MLRVPKSHLVIQHFRESLITIVSTTPEYYGVLKDGGLCKTYPRKMLTYIQYIIMSQPRGIHARQAVRRRGRLGIAKSIVTIQLGTDWNCGIVHFPASAPFLRSLASYCEYGRQQLRLSSDGTSVPTH